MIGRYFFFIPTFTINMGFPSLFREFAVEIVLADGVHVVSACAVKEPLLFNVTLAFYPHQLNSFPEENPIHEDLIRHVFIDYLQTNYVIICWKLHLY